jgi:hypothetical protein
MGNANVGVAVCAAVGDNTIAGVNVAAGIDVVVGVNVATGVSIEGSAVAVIFVVVGVAFSPVEGAQAETNKKINKMILYTFTRTLLINQ